MMYIHYRPSDGEIFGWETGTVEPVGLNGMSIVSVEMNVQPDSLTQKINVATLQIVGKTEVEKVQSLQPTINELKQKIFSELSATDNMMMPDRDDILPQDRIKWVAYRKALRDLSKGDPKPTSAEMVVAWPLDPTGKDAIENLRNRNR